MGNEESKHGGHRREHKSNSRVGENHTNLMIENFFKVNIFKYFRGNAKEPIAIDGLLNLLFVEKKFSKKNFFS
jgi:hypothetical protein